MDVLVREERAGDEAAVREVLLAAFPTPAEAGLVEALRAAAEHFESLVAVADGDGGRIVGHILFTEMELVPEHDGLVLGLAPLAVAPEWQDRGVGAALVEAGLERCRDLGARLVIVLGEPGYYPRFGFEPASRLGLRSTYDVPDEAFMALPLDPDAEWDPHLAKYRPEFDGLE